MAFLHPWKHSLCCNIIVNWEATSHQDTPKEEMKISLLNGWRRGWWSRLRQSQKDLRWEMTSMEWSNARTGQRILATKSTISLSSPLSLPPEQCVAWNTWKMEGFAFSPIAMNEWKTSPSTKLMGKIQCKLRPCCFFFLCTIWLEINLVYSYCWCCCCCQKSQNIYYVNLTIYKKSDKNKIQINSNRKEEKRKKNTWGGERKWLSIKAM